MISTETPYKLAEIIRDTWPQLFMPHKESRINQEKIINNNHIVIGEDKL
jgi:hypothetical protein